MVVKTSNIVTAETKTSNERTCEIEILVPGQVILVEIKGLYDLSKDPSYDPTQDLSPIQLFSEAIKKVGKKYHIYSGLSIIEPGHPTYGSWTPALILFVEER